MINRIQVTTVFVNDQDKAREFYVKKLGLTAKIDMPDFGWLEVMPDGGETSLSLSKLLPGMPQSVIGGPKGIIFNTTDIKSDHARLKANGVQFVQEPTPQPWGGIEARFSDPDGNVFSLVERTDGQN